MTDSELEEAIRRRKSRSWWTTARKVELGLMLGAASLLFIVPALLIIVQGPFDTGGMVAVGCGVIAALPMLIWGITFLVRYLNRSNPSHSR